jgi:hypothetical protein
VTGEGRQGVGASWKQAACLLLAALSLGCAARPLRRFPLVDVVWTDPDQRTYLTPPAEQETYAIWDGMDNTVLLRMSEGLRFRPATEAMNVNALDEVPDSSWFSNRLGRRPMTPQEVAQGACLSWELPPVPWTIVGGKPNGVNPGFVIKDAKGKKFLLKVDGKIQIERNSGADAVAALFYHAAGYHTPCNLVVQFRREDFRLGEGVKVKNDRGEKEPLTEKHVEDVLSRATVTPEGRYRAGASLFIEGKTLGPWTYIGVKEDDPNDVVPHEERREVRGMRVLAALVNHMDSRQENTMMSWIKGSDGRGHVRHYMLDFSDSFGSIWAHEPAGVADSMSRRLGHSNYLDLEHVSVDFLTLGAVTRPWDRAQLSPVAGNTFGYFDAERFDPDDWHNGYPNPAFARCTERDSAWMARILSELTDAHLDAACRRGQWTKDVYREELVRILARRRDKILERHLTRLSPLARPEVAGGELCLVDLAVRSGIRSASSRVIGAVAFVGDGLVRTGMEKPVAGEKGQVCVRLPAAPGASASSPGYMVVDLTVSTPGRDTPGPARVHLYHLGGAEYRVVGLERPATAEPPLP